MPEEGGRPVIEDWVKPGVRVVLLTEPSDATHCTVIALDEDRPDGNTGPGTFRLQRDTGCLGWMHWSKLRREDLSGEDVGYTTQGPARNGRPLEYPLPEIVKEETT
jgi:hypothetical protein